MLGKHLEQRVKRLLSEDVKYQKSDLALISRIWYDDLNKIFYDRIDNVTAIKFLDLLRNGDLTRSESVTRCRRKLQQKYPHLRDDAVYKGRKDKEVKMRKTSQWY
tara:strand:+ start:241 stop:555 length:315 start_codon:yes stop_codon:yes gene_type:complete